MADTQRKTEMVATFNYSQLDGSIADFLRTKERNMREIVGRAYTELGRELTEARDRLAGNNQYDGMFERWLESIGMNRMQAGRLIQRYSLVTKCDDQHRELLEDMPVSLTYEIAKPSAESTPAKAQAKSEVLRGEIDTLKAYRERIAELEAENETLQNTLESIEEQPPTVEYRTEYVRDESVEERLRRYEERFGDIEIHESTTMRLATETEVEGLVLGFSEDVRDLIKRYSFLEHYVEEFTVLSDLARKEYIRSLEAIGNFAYGLSQTVDGGRQEKRVIIDVN